jgi:hypothetical protein
MIKKGSQGLARVEWTRYLFVGIHKKGFPFRKPFVFSCFWHKPYKWAWRHRVLHRFSIYHEITSNVVYLFSIFHGDVITPNLGSYRADMTISPTAPSQSKLESFSIKFPFIAIHLNDNYVIWPGSLALMNHEPITLRDLLIWARLQDQKVCVIIERVYCAHSCPRDHVVSMVIFSRFQHNTVRVWFATWKHEHATMGWGHLREKWNKQ